MLDTPDDHKVEAGDNPRDQERDQIVRLLNIVADRIYVGRYDPAIGSGKLEDKVRKDENVPDDHLRAHRMGREEIIYAWIELLLLVCQNGVVAYGKVWDRDKPFHRALPEPVWQTVDNFVVNFSRLPLWKNRVLAATAFGGKRNMQFWKDAFASGSADGVPILAGGGVNLVEMMKPPS